MGSEDELRFREPGHPYVLGEVEGVRTLAGAPVRLHPIAWLREVFGEKRWVVPLLLFVLSFGVYSGFAAKRILKTSADPHFVYLANTYNSMIAASFSDEAAKQREGKAPFEIDKRPPHQNDWASYWEITLKPGDVHKGIWLDKPREGRFRRLDGSVIYLGPKDLRGSRTKQRFFVSFPPGPAVVMMPFALVSGYEVNDTLLTVLFAAFNVALMYLLLVRLSTGGRSERSRRDNLWLTAMFAFGTCHLWCAVLGQVWFTALIMGVTFTLLYMHCAIDARRPVLAGIFVAAAFATRTPLLFSAVFFYAFVLFPGGKLRRDGWGDAAKKVALFSAVPLVVGVSLLLSNHARFESLSEFGHTYLAGGSLERIKTYGLFNFHFVSKNLSALLTLLPRLQPTDPYVVVSKHGMSLFLTTPALFWLFRPQPRVSAEDRFWWRLLWFTVIAIGTLPLFYQNTGYEQFGYRFSLDYTPYLVALLAVGRHKLDWKFKLAVVCGFVVNAFGAVTFKRFGRFYTESFFA